MSTAVGVRPPLSHALVEAQRGALHARLDGLRAMRQRARRREAALGRSSIYRASLDERIDERIDALLDELLALRHGARR